MKKSIFILTLLLCGIFFTGCSQKQSSQDDVFEKQKECINLENNIKQQIVDIKDDLQAKVGGRDTTTRHIDQIFYSKKRNSCIYSVNVYGSGYLDFEVRFYDYFTREFLGTSSTCTGFGEKGKQGECSNKQSEYNSLLQQFKRE